MAVPPDAAWLPGMVVAIVAIALQYYADRRFGTAFFRFGLMCTCAMAVSLLASLPGAVWPQLQALADIGILLAGCAAFAASAWLSVAFQMAGDPDDG